MIFSKTKKEELLKEIEIILRSADYSETAIKDFINWIEKKLNNLK